MFFESIIFEIYVNYCLEGLKSNLTTLFRVFQAKKNKCDLNTLK